MSAQEISHFTAISAALREKNINIGPEDLRNLNSLISGSAEEGALNLNISQDITIDFHDGEGKYEQDITTGIPITFNAKAQITSPNSGDKWHARVELDGKPIYDGDLLYDHLVEAGGKTGWGTTKIVVLGSNQTNRHYNGQVIIHVEV